MFATADPFRTLAVIALLACTAAAPAQTTPPAASQPAASRPVDREIYGRLQRAYNVPVVEVWGTPEQAGFAHGYLLGPQIVALFDDYASNPMILGATDGYEQLLKAASQRLTWKPEWQQELEGILRGMHERMGADAVYSQRLKRPLTLDDLKAVNALSDFRGLGCSTISVWGPLTFDGRTLTARNLDFPYTELMIRSQILLVRRNTGDRRSWLSVTWPGLIGVYTAMNDNGVTAMIHDAPGLRPSSADGFSPRSLALRDALETSAAASFAADFQKGLARHKFIRGNSFHVSAPAPADGSPAALVFECDGNEKDGGITLRRPAGVEKHLSAMYCTNHMRARTDPTKCKRFETFEATIQQAIDRGQTFDGAKMLATMDSVRQSDTIHTVVAEPETRVMYVRIPGVATTAQRFQVGEWFRRPADKPVKAKL